MEDILSLIILISCLLYMLYVVIEYFVIKKLRSKIKCIIHVNGIRGKSTTTRLIDSGLRNLGYKVASKTTGTIPTYIDVDGNECPIKRLGPANIKEQIKTLRRAVKEGVDYLVIECMAVNPEYQYNVEHKILHSNITVITNVRMDHMDQMGDSLESIAYSLSNTVPKNGTVLLGDNTCLDIFNEIAAKLNSNVVVAQDYNGDTLDTFKENIAIALEIPKILGLDENKFKEGLKYYKRDPGALKTYKSNGFTFINGFSINDSDSIKEVLDLKVYPLYKKEDVTLLVNFRSDRAFRTNDHIKLLKELGIKNVIISGSNLDYIKHELKDSDLNIIDYKSIDDLKRYPLIFAIGNIKGVGNEIINILEKEEKVND